MSTEILMEKDTEVFVRLNCEPHVKMELNHYFRFRPNGYQFMPMYRRKKWDGYVYLFNMDNHRIYAGLKPEINRFAVDREYKLIDNTGDNLRLFPMMNILNSLHHFLVNTN